MAAIDRNQIVADSILYLPEQNTLDCRILTSLAESVINNQISADDNTNYSEALCKLLRAAGLLNQAKHTVDQGSLKREEVDEVVYEYFENSNADIWKTYLKNLPNICPLLPGGGYTGLSLGIGMTISPGEEIEIPEDCPADVFNETGFQ